ncbi:archaeosortase/exosortase family protein [Candidatus Micrarchaeota archaeon]|nr:archaeosortase/exosortase family protein [Candidatus Micrarchaeota archaeon]
MFLVLIALDLSFLTQAIASIQRDMLGHVGTYVTQDGSSLQFGHYVVHIVAECSGFVMVILLAALLWSTPIPERKRWKALVLLTPFLLLFNLARLWLTILVFFYVFPYFEIVHVSLWFIDSALVLGLWYCVFLGKL